MNKEELKEKIIEILKNSPFKGELFEGQCEFWANDILELLEAQRQEWQKEWREKIKNIQGDCIKDPFDEEHEFISKATILKLLNNMNKEELNEKVSNYTG